MIISVGIDVCPVSRMQKVLDRHGDRFKKRVFAQSEIDFAGTGAVSTQRLAARFAAKEAAMKALYAPSGIGFRDIIVNRGKDSPPTLEFRGVASKQAEKLGVCAKHLSLTHAGDVAAAVVVLEGAVG